MTYWRTSTTWRIARQLPRIEALAAVPELRLVLRRREIKPASERLGQMRLRTEAGIAGGALDGVACLQMRAGGLQPQRFQKGARCHAGFFNIRLGREQ